MLLLLLLASSSYCLLILSHANSVSVIIVHLKIVFAVLKFDYIVVELVHAIIVNIDSYARLLLVEELSESVGVVAHVDDVDAEVVLLLLCLVHVLIAIVVILPIGCIILIRIHIDHL